jgi:hypothetical protein
LYMKTQPDTNRRTTSETTVQRIIFNAFFMLIDERFLRLLYLSVADAVGILHKRRRRNYFCPLFFPELDGSKASKHLAWIFALHFQNQIVNACDGFDIHQQIFEAKISKARFKIH